MKDRRTGNPVTTRLLYVAAVFAIWRLKVLRRQTAPFMLRISTRDSLNGGLGCLPTDNTQGPELLIR